MVLLLLIGLLTITIVHRMQRLVELSGKRRPDRPAQPHVVAAADAADPGCARAPGRVADAGALDLDRFRRVNDEIGARDGDRALRQISAMMLEDARAARTPRAHRRTGIRAAAAMPDRQRLGARRPPAARRWPNAPFLPGSGGEPQRITFSAGLVAWPQDGADLSALLRSADRRLQLAKRDGCNRVDCARRLTAHGCATRTAVTIGAMQIGASRHRSQGHPGADGRA